MRLLWNHWRNQPKLKHLIQHRLSYFPLKYYTVTSDMGKANSKVQQEETVSRKTAMSKKEAIMELAKEILPGKSLLTKSIWGASIVGASSLLTHYGYYIPSDDTYSMTAFFVLLRVLYLKLGQPLSQYLDQEIALEESRWNQARTQEKSKYSAQLEHLQSFKDLNEALKLVYEMRKSVLVMEEELKSLKARAQVRVEILGAAQDLVKREQERIIEEQRIKRAQLREELDRLLADPLVQKRILTKAISDLETKPIISLQAH